MVALAIVYYVIAGAAFAIVFGLCTSRFYAKQADWSGAFIVAFVAWPWVASRLLWAAAGDLLRRFRG